jgi:hypothetical protein
MMNFDYEEIPDGYYDLVFKKSKGLQSSWHYNKFHFVFQMVSERDITAQIDLACGPGTYLGNFQTASNALGIDIAQNQINYASENYNRPSLNYSTISINEIQASLREDVQLITMIEFIEHISSEDFRNLLLTLRAKFPRARVVITTPNYTSLWPVLEFLINRFTKGVSYDQQHISKYTVRKLKKILDEEGVAIVRIRKFLGFSPFLGFFSKRLAQRASACEDRFSLIYGHLIFCEFTF